jgi:CrcB protein
MSRSLTIVAAVACGGAIGAVARYLMSEWVSGLAPRSTFPWGTLTVNVVGAFLLGGLLGATIDGRFPMGTTGRAFIGVGLLGGFTTFSTFTYETIEAFRLRDWTAAMGNIGLSLAAGLVACWLGLVLGSRIWGTS